jgi:hypothetical protein
MLVLEEVVHPQAGEARRVPVEGQVSAVAAPLGEAHTVRAAARPAEAHTAQAAAAVAEVSHAHTGSVPAAGLALRTRVRAGAAVRAPRLSDARRDRQGEEGLPLARGRAGVGGRTGWAWAYARDRRQRDLAAGLGAGTSSGTAGAAQRRTVGLEAGASRAMAEGRPARSRDAGEEGCSAAGRGSCTATSGH